MNQTSFPTWNPRGPCPLRFGCGVYLIVLALAALGLALWGEGVGRGVILRKFLCHGNGVEGGSQPSATSQGLGCVKQCGQGPALQPLGP